MREAWLPRSAFRLCHVRKRAWAGALGACGDSGFASEAAGPQVWILFPSGVCDSFLGLGQNCHPGPVLHLYQEKKKIKIRAITWSVITLNRVCFPWEETFHSGSSLMPPWLDMTQWHTMWFRIKTHVFIYLFGLCVFEIGSPMLPRLLLICKLLNSWFSCLGYPRRGDHRLIPLHPEKESYFNEHSFELYK